MYGFSQIILGYIYNNVRFYCSLQTFKTRPDSDALLRLAGSDLSRALSLIVDSDWSTTAPGDVIAPNAHSTVQLGVGLRILLATREISPFSVQPRVSVIGTNLRFK